jgi:hypothetical protein
MKRGEAARSRRAMGREALPPLHASDIMAGPSRSSSPSRAAAAEADPGELGDFGMGREGARQADWLGRGVGLAVFAGGVILLVIVFVEILKLGSKVIPQGTRLDLNWAAGFGVNIACLFVAGLVASWIAARGAQLYAAAGRAAAGE